MSSTTTLSIDDLKAALMAALAAETPEAKAAREEAERQRKLAENKAMMAAEAEKRKAAREEADRIYKASFKYYVDRRINYMVEAAGSELADNYNEPSGSYSLMFKNKEGWDSKEFFEYLSDKMEVMEADLNDLAGQGFTFSIDIEKKADADEYEVEVSWSNDLEEVNPFDSLFNHRIGTEEE
jgi:hypothetical protein